MDNIELLACFSGIIGIKGCHDKSNPAYLVNDLNGMSTELVDKIADGDNETYLDVFNKCLKSGINSLREDILDVLLRDKRRLNFGETIYSSEKARIVRPYETETFNSNYIGVLLTTAESKYLFAQVNSLSVYPTTAIEVLPRIYDYESDSFIYTANETITLTANQLNTVEFDFELNSNEHRAVMVILEKVNFGDSFELNLLSCNRFKESKCNSCDPCDSVSAYGIGNISSVNFTNIGLDKNNQFEILPFYSNVISDLEQIEAIKPFICLDIDLICSIDDFICQNAKRLANALNYKVGANILSEKLGGFRISNMAKGNLEFTRETKEELNKEYRKVLERVVPNLPLDGVSMCWECENEVGTWTDSMV